jgi:AcrR family transcriptional regulator
MSNSTPPARAIATRSQAGPVAPSPERAPSSRAPTRRPGQAGGKRDTNRRERTEALHKSAIALFLERGVENVTVDEIAKAAGTAKGNFYRYAADKRELVEAIMAPVAEAFDRAFSRCDARMSAATSSAELTPAYLGLAMELLETVRVHPDVVQLWLQESRAPAVGARIPIADFDRELTTRTVALTEMAHQQGLLRKIPATISALAVVGAVERLLIAYLRDGLFANPAEVIQPLVRLVMEGIVG